MDLERADPEHANPKKANRQKERMKEIFILRHGETEWNVEQRMQGRMDSPLTRNGRSHADNNGKLLKRIANVECLCVSPSGRTLETAYIVNSYLQAQFVTFDELMERDVGDWSGLTVADIEKHFPQAWVQRQDDPHGYRPPNGENLVDMLERVRHVLDEIYASDHFSVGIVTHGVMSKVILQYFLELNTAETNAIKHPNNLVYRLTFNSDGIETHHFLDGAEAQRGLYKGEFTAEVTPLNS